MELSAVHRLLVELGRVDAQGGWTLHEDEVNFLDHRVAAERAYASTPYRLAGSRVIQVSDEHLDPSEIVRVWQRDRIAFRVEPHAIGEQELLALVGRLLDRRLGADVELPAWMPLSVVGDPTDRGVVDRKSVTRQGRFAEHHHPRLPAVS
jgi:hypothetical protein